MLVDIHIQIHYTTPISTTLQLLMHDALPSPALQIRHRHNLNHQTRPARKMLRSLPRARFRVILLPREARSFPFVEDVFDKVFAKGGVDFGGLGFVGPRLDCDVLDNVIEMLSTYLDGGIVTYVEAFHSEVVHVHPYGASPVILICTVELIILAQTS